MHRFKIEDLPKTFKNTFKKPDHKYPTKFSFFYSLKKHVLKSSSSPFPTEDIVVEQNS